MLVTKDNVSWVLGRLEQAEELVVDTETTGLRPWHGDRLVGIAIKAGKLAYYLPFRHEAGTNLPIEYLAPVIRIISRKRQVYFHAAFDIAILQQDGMPIPDQMEDVMLAAHLMNENEESFALKKLSDKYIGSDSSKDEEELNARLAAIGQKKGGIRFLSPEEVASYATADVDLTAKLRDFYLPHFGKWQLLDLWKEVNTYQLAVCRMAERGLKLDVPLIERYMEEAEVHYRRTLDTIESVCGERINPNSAPQVCRVLGVSSSRKEVLDELDGELPGLIRQARGWSKVNGTYYRPYLELRDQRDILHPNLSLIGTDTGRLSCSSPNLQAVARQSDVFKVKDVFIAHPGEVLVNVDYSQAEIRVGAHYAQEKRMIEALLAKRDIHQETVDEMANLGVKLDRDTAKRINFGIQYGLGVPGFMQKFKVSEEQAAQTLNAHRRLYPGFRQLYFRAQETAEQRRYIRLFTGRLRRYNTHKAEPHKAMSNLIQGSVAEIIRIAITKIDKELRSEGVHQLLQVHDSILMSLPEDRVNNLLPEVLRIMEGFDGFSVPLIVDAKVGKSWGKMNKWERP